MVMTALAWTEISGHAIVYRARSAHERNGRLLVHAMSLAAAEIKLEDDSVLATLVQVKAYGFVFEFFFLRHRRRDAYVQQRSVSTSFLESMDAFRAVFGHIWPWHTATSACLRRRCANKAMGMQMNSIA